MKSSKLFLIFLILAGTYSANFVLAAEKIDINTAPINDLMKIIHIGEARAKELISLRPFSSVDELTKIKGVGEARIRDIKEQNLAWVATLSESGSPQDLTAAAEEPLQLTQSGKTLTPVLVAIFTSLLSGIIILVLRKKLYVRT